MTHNEPLHFPLTVPHTTTDEPQRGRISIPLHVVLYRSVTKPDSIVAFCLETSHTAMGTPHSEAVIRLMDKLDKWIDTSVKMNKIRAIFRPAESMYWANFAVGDPVHFEGIQKPRHCNSVVMRYYNPSVHPEF